MRVFAHFLCDRLVCDRLVSHRSCEDIVFLDSDEDKRKRDLMESVGLYRKISDIYGRLGIVE